MRCKFVLYLSLMLILILSNCTSNDKTTPDPIPDGDDETTEVAEIADEIDEEEEEIGESEISDSDISDQDVGDIEAVDKTTKRGKIQVQDRLDYGAVQLGMKSSQNLHIENIGAGPLTIYSVSLFGEEKDSFYIEEKIKPFIVKSLAYKDLAITFAQDDPYPYYCNITKLAILSDDAESSYKTVDLVINSKCRMDGELRAHPNELEFEATVAGEVVEKSFSITARSYCGVPANIVGYYLMGDPGNFTVSKVEKDGKVLDKDNLDVELYDGEKIVFTIAFQVDEIGTYGNAFELKLDSSHYSQYFAQVQFWGKYGDFPDGDSDTEATEMDESETTDTTEETEVEVTENEEAEIAEE